MGWHPAFYNEYTHTPTCKHSFCNFSLLSWEVPLSISLYVSLYLSLQASLLYLQRVTERRKGCGSQRENSGKYTQQSVNSKYTVEACARLSGRCTGSPSTGEGLHVAQLSASSDQVRVQSSHHTTLGRGLWLCLWSSTRRPSGPLH